MATIPVKDANDATVNVELPLAPGAAGAAASRPVTLSTEDVAKLGALTETAPATDTASSGLNGRLQRVAQRLTSVETAITGSVADGGADSGNSSKVAGVALGSLAAVTLDTAGDRAPLATGLDRVLIIRPFVAEDTIDGCVEITDGTSTSIIASAGAGVRNFITDVTISNTSATAVEVDLRDGAAGTVKWTFPVPANTSGVVKSFATPLKFSAATAVCADPSSAASTITVSLAGYKSKVG